MKALILVDLQKDFMPGGALPTTHGFDILPTINVLLSIKFDLIAATKDWHPANHVSFASTHHKNPGDIISVNGIEQILWPVHCIQDTLGASFAEGWNSSKIQHIIYKGTDINIDSYSAFFDNAHLKQTNLSQLIESHNIRILYFAGVATDYCVKFSVLDAIMLGYDTYVITDACKPVHPKDEKSAFLAMKQAGAHLINSRQIL